MKKTTTTTGADDGFRHLVHHLNQALAKGFPNPGSSSARRVIELLGPMIVDVENNDRDGSGLRWLRNRMAGMPELAAPEPAVDPVESNRDWEQLFAMLDQLNRAGAGSPLGAGSMRSAIRIIDRMVLCQYHPGAIRYLERIREAISHPEPARPDAPAPAIRSAARPTDMAIVLPIVQGLLASGRYHRPGPAVNEDNFIRRDNGKDWNDETGGELFACRFGAVVIEDAIHLAEELFDQLKIDDALYLFVHGEPLD